MRLIRWLGAVVFLLALAALSVLPEPLKGLTATHGITHDAAHIIAFLTAFLIAAGQSKTWNRMLFWAFALVCFLKGKPRLGTIGIFIPGVAPVGAIRLARPSSLWARHWYGEERLVRSQEREDTHHLRYARARHRLYDWIGGIPHLDRTQA